MSHLTNYEPVAARTSPIRQALRLRIPVAVVTMACAALGLMANAFAVYLGHGPVAATHPLTALCLFGVGFWALRMKRFGQRDLGRHIILGLVLMVCAARVMGWAVGTGAPLSVYGPVGPFGGQFSAEAGLALGGFAAAGLMRQSQGRAGIVFLVIALGIVYNVLVETAYGVTFFAGEVSLFTALGLMSASIAMISVYVHRPFVRVSFLVGAFGSQVRVMAAAAVVVPFVGGFVLYALKPYGGAGFPIEAAMSSAVSWVLLVVLLGSSARLEGTAAANRRTARDIAMRSRIDPLTKALNRFGMMEALEGAWVQFCSTGTHFGLILLDLNDFNALNETLGHSAGDATLERVSAALEPQLRDSDALGRWGGGEFLMLLKIKDRADLDVVADRLQVALRALDSPFAKGSTGGASQITATLGLSEMTMGDHGPAEAITRADVALYLEKERALGKVAATTTAAAFVANSAAA